MNDQTCIRLATRKDAAAVSALRAQEYQSSPHFRITNMQFLEKLRWSEKDDVSDVLSIWREGELIATIRVECFYNQSDLHNFASGHIPPADHFEWPAFALSRSVVHVAHRRTGLQSLMRYYVIESALRRDVRHLYGYAAITADGVASLSKLGYEFAKRPDQDPDLTGQRPWQLFWIDLRQRGEQALALLHNSIRSQSQQYPWTGPRPQLHLRRRLVGSATSQT